MTVYTAKTDHVSVEKLRAWLKSYAASDTEGHLVDITPAWLTSQPGNVGRTLLRAMAQVIDLQRAQLVSILSPLIDELEELRGCEIHQDCLQNRSLAVACLYEQRKQKLVLDRSSTEG